VAEGTVRAHDRGLVAVLVCVLGSSRVALRRTRGRRRHTSGDRRDRSQATPARCRATPRERRALRGRRGRSQCPRRRMARAAGLRTRDTTRCRRAVCALQHHQTSGIPLGSHRLPWSSRLHLPHALAVVGERESRPQRHPHRLLVWQCGAKMSSESSVNPPESSSTLATSCSYAAVLYLRADPPLRVR